MSTLFFDIETNGIQDWNKLSDLETVHCLCVVDEQNKEYRFNTVDDNIQDGLDLLKSADVIVGHNSINFDYPALALLYKFKHDNVQDTIVMSRVLYPDLKRDDHRAGRNNSMVGSHSLKAWGQRLQILKGDYGEGPGDVWDCWSKEMEDYCVQDTIVTKNLYEHLTKNNPSKTMLDLEHEFSRIMRRQEWNGFCFDKEKADKLAADLCVKRVELKDELEELFEPTIIEMKSYWYVDNEGNKYSSKKAMRDLGYKEDQIFQGEKKTKSIPFNPGSRDQIADRLMKRGWKPAAYEGKRPQINEGVLKDIKLKEAERILEYLLVTKRLGQIAEGDKAWVQLEKNGRIHGQVVTNGTISGRCSHRYPNMAQVPAVRAPYGAECRELFRAPPGKVLVGADASGLELRCLAHYLHPFDKGEYEKIILEGDIHSANQKAAGLNTRDEAKTFIYAFLYGAGDSKIGQIVGGNSKKGKELKESFMTKTPAIRKLYAAVTDAVKTRGTLRGLDGRPLPCRSIHSAVNLLLQSAGAVIMKQTTIEFCKLAKKPYQLHANVHDEIQFSCDEEHAIELGSNFIEAIQAAGKFLKFNCQLDGEYKIGQTWKDTH